VGTGGGWKIFENQRMSVEEFRRMAQETLGVLPKNCLDIYGMVEGNGWMVHCPEGHYLHVPTTYYHAMVLDENGEPVGYGEKGRFAFLDGLSTGYPGFIITGDEVTMHEHCPVCGRESPVLEPEVKRAAGTEARGCAEEMRRVMSMDLGG
jgi:acyl-coenzyme A synthetase/AMP-(fatty) acid ligase